MANLFKKIITLNYQQVRYLPRWNHRRPVNVIAPENYDSKTDSFKKGEQIVKTSFPEFENHQNEYPKINWKQPPKEKSAQNFTKPKNFATKTKNVKPITITHKKQEYIPKKRTTTDMLKATINGEGEIIYTKMGDNDIRISKIMAEVKSRKFNESKDLMLLEGKVLIKEALEAGCKLEYVLFSRMKEVEYLKPYLPKIGAELYKMPYKEMQTWSDLVTTPGIMAIFKIPDTEKFVTQNSLPLTIICDNIREPNNLGSILRTCSGVGCEKVILTKGCVNVWDSKVLRSACGAHFKLHISKKQTWDEIVANMPDNSNVFVADNSVVSIKGEDNNSVVETLTEIPVLPYYSVNFKLSNNIILIIGGETEGISDYSYKLAQEQKGVRLNVPLSNGLDSLNTGTALGIIAFEIKRQLTMLKTENLEDYKIRNMSLNT